MATQVQLRRGNTSQTNAFTGAVGEITIDTDKDTVVVHDGSTLGGIPLAKEGNLTAIFVQANSSFDKANSANVLAQGAFDKANSANVLAQEAYNKANSVTQQGFVTITANGVDIIADANNDTLTLTSANGIAIYPNATNDSILLNLSLTGVTSGTYGNTTFVPTITTDSYGRISEVTNTAIAFPVTSVAGVTGAVSNNDLLNGIISVDGTGSNLDADLLDGLQGSSYANSNFTQASFDKANSANILAQGAYDTANNEAGVNATQNTNITAANTLAVGAFDKANSANVLAQEAYNQANTATTLAQGGYNLANTNATLAQGAFDKANSANVLAQNGYDQANTATTLAQGAFNKANSANVLAQNAYDSSNTKFSSSGGTISGDVTITGNLSVSGNTITVDSEVLRVNDSIILLANNNIGDTVDIGFAAHYGDTSNNHTGLVRHATDKKWYLFENYEDHFIHGTNTINIADPTFVTSNLVANLQAPTEVIIKNINVLDQANGAYSLANTNSTLGQNAFNKANSANVLAQEAYNQANTANTLAQGAFDKANTSNTLAQGAYNQANTGTTIAIGSFNQANAAFDLANGTAGIANTDVTNITITDGTYGNSTHVPVVTLSANGRVNAISTVAITASDPSALAFAIALG
jgi:hypothetical protein